MKSEKFLIIIFILLSSITSINAVDSVNKTINNSFSNLSPNNGLLEITPPNVENIPFFDWKQSEDNYWKEQIKNDKLTKILGNISDGVDLSKPSVNSKVSSTNYYIDNMAINIDLNKIFYKPGDQVNFIVQTTLNMTPISKQLYLSIYDSENSFYYQYGGGYYHDKGVNPILSSSIITDSNGFYQGSFIASNEGQYTIYVTQEPITQNYYYGSSAYRVVTVSDLAIYSRIPYYYIPSQPITGYTIILNGSNFKPIFSADINITYYNFDWNSNAEQLQASWVGKTDEYGKVEFAIPTDFSTSYWGYLVLTATKDNVKSTLVRSIWSSYYYNKQSGIDFVPTLDKPIYQPGETLHARVLVWNNVYLNATKFPLINEPIIIKFLNSQSILLFQFQRITDEYGIITFDLPLDESLTVGNYKLIFQKDNFQQFIEVQIDYYEKPAYKVVINLDKQYVPNGQLATGFISAQYYFGKPVTNSQTTIILKSGDGSVKSEKSGFTDNKGIFYFSLPVTVSDSEPQLNIVASVTDPVGRIVESKTSIVTVSDLYIGAWNSPWTPSPTDEIQVSFYAYQGLNLNARYYSYYSWEPVSNQKATIEIKGINSGLFSNSVTILKELEAETNQYGFGYIKFTLSSEIVSKYTSFEIEVKLDLNDGRSGSYKYTMEYSKFFTKISFDKNIYSAGDTVKTTVKVLDIKNNSAIASVRISVFDADYDVLYQGSEIISDSITYNLKLSQFAPIGDYIVYTIITYKVQGEWGYIYDRFVYGGQNAFKVGAEEKLNIDTSQESYSSGETIKIKVSLLQTPVNPIYFEISKRGVIRVDSFIPSSNEFEIIINNTEYLAPKITILLLTILPNGIILENLKIITIEQKISLQITTDKQSYKPGDQATITIKLFNNNNESIDGMSVISLIDSSVYGVKEDPNWELDHFSNDDYWSIMATSTNWRGFQPIWFYYWFWFDYPIYYFGVPVYYADWNIKNAESDALAGDQQRSPTVSTDQIDIRDNLPESMNWQPESYIPKNGLTFNTTLADTIGEWTIRVTATKGQTGVIEKQTFTTILPFFIEIDKPATSIQDDVISIKGIFYNYLEYDIEANVSIEVDNSIILNKETQSLRIPTSFLSSVRWSVYLPNFGLQNVTIFAQTILNGTIYSDGLRKQLTIIPNAIDESSTKSGTITSDGTSFNITQYSESVKNDQYLVISKGVNDVVLDSWQRLIGYPYGCLEQTMSKLIPDLLVLEYLEQNNKLTDTLKNSIEEMIVSGIARIYSMQKNNGGFGWFGNNQSNVYMTSYAIYGLNKLINYNYTSNTYALSEAVKYLTQNQFFDGHWSADYWYMDDIAFTAFTIRNLVGLNVSETNQINATIDKAISYLKNSWDLKKDAYTAALYLLATYGTSRYDSSFGSALIDFILSQQQTGSNEGIFWSTDDYYWKPLGGTTETTALVLQALLKINYSQYYSVISSGLKWLLQEQNPWGWSTTKGTSESLTAIIEFTSYAINSTNGFVDVYVNEVNKTRIIIDDNVDIEPIDFASFLSTGNNIITLASSPNSTFIYYFSSRQMLKSNPILEFDDKILVQPNSDFEIPFNLVLNSNKLSLKNVIITLLQDNMQNISSLTYNIPVVNSSLSGSFKLHSGTELGIINLKGIEIEYLLTSSDLKVQSLGKIKQIFGPIVLNVSSAENVKNSLLKGLITNNLETIDSYLTKSSNNLIEENILIQKTFSKVEKIKTGDFVDISLTIEAIKDISDQYLLATDSIPSGFDLDKQSINANSGLTSYSLSGSKLSLFISSLHMNAPITINYRIQAKTFILASISPAVVVGSMYNESMKAYSNSNVLGSNLISKSIYGEVLKDFSKPNLVELKYSVENQQIYYHILANDAEGIESVKVFIKENSWQNIDLQSTIENEFNGNARIMNGGKIFFYVQIQDVNGNNFESELLFIEIPVIIIEIGLIIGILFFTGIISISGYKISKKKLLKESNFDLEEKNK